MYIRRYIDLLYIRSAQFSACIYNMYLYRIKILLGHNLHRTARFDYIQQAHLSEYIYNIELNRSNSSPFYYILLHSQFDTLNNRSLHINNTSLYRIEMYLSAYNHFHKGFLYIRSVLL